MKLYSLFTVLALPWLVWSLGATDSIRDADAGGSGYLPNHNIDPNIINSTTFGILWTNTYNSLEKWYGRPLVYTTPTVNNGAQFVFFASTQNIIRTIDGKTGKAIASRQLIPPFLQSDIGCTDIPNYIGIVGTPIIDPATDTVYLFAKGYKNGASGGGVEKGIYQFYAINLVDLSDRPGFPVLIDGHNCDNDPTRYFVGGTVLQRPALTIVNGVVWGGFGGHCDKYNYTGMVVGVSQTAGVGVTSMFCMETSPYSDPVVSDINIQTGGKAGIWMGGMGISTDGGRLFFSTGNGQGHQNQGNPASGRVLMSTLDECVVNLAVSSSGKLSLADYFEPYEYISMDAADRDLGSAGISLLDPAVFKGAGVSKMAISVGKNGKAYILNADNLGGYKNGPGNSDGIIQTLQTGGAIFAGVGSYPGEGGYIYFTPVGGPTTAWKLGHDGAGNPLFSQVGTTYRSYGANPGIANSAGRVGPGIPTVTTFKGQAGTALMWRTDPDGGLQVFSAVPDSKGYLQQLPIPQTNGLNKFLRPAFGDGRLYVSDNQGNLICMGSPVSVPLICSSPVDFGDLAFGGNKTATVNCTAQIAITSLAGLKTSDASWVASNSSLPKGPLTAGQNFSFPVTWNLASASNQQAQNASYGVVSPGIKSGVLTVFTNNGVVGYTTSYPVSLIGNEVSKTPFLQLSPGELDFAGLVLGTASAANGVPDSFIITNAGSTAMKILGYGAAKGDADDGYTYTNTTKNANGTVLGPNFVSKDIPAVGSLVQPGQSVTVSVTFSANKVGAYSLIFQIWSDGGDKYILMSGSASTAPIGTLSVETSEGGWDPNPVMDFGVVPAGTVVTRRIRICNTGGSALTITKSKPPIQTELKAENPGGDFHEGQTIPVDSCAYGPIDIAANPQQANTPDHTVSDEWILNTDDINFGVKDVKITAIIRPLQVGPKTSNGSALYRELGCYSDSAGRNLQQQVYNRPNNTNGDCIQYCSTKGYKFAGTEYKTECWCGNFAPKAPNYSDPALKKCSFVCPGDTSQICGGNGGLINVFYNSSAYTPGCDSLPCTSTSSSSSMSQTSTSSVSSSTSSSSVSVNSTTSSSSASSTSSSSSVSSSASSSSSASLTSTSSASSTSSSASSTASASSSGWIYLSCYQDPNNPPINKAIYPYTKTANDSMTVELCQNICKGGNNQYAGVEYGRECYCGNALATGATAGSTSGCDIKCANNATQTCGGRSFMNIYKAGAASASSSSSSVASSSVSSSASSSASSSVSSSVSSSALSSVSSSVSPSSSSVSSSTSSSSVVSTSSSSAAPSSTTSAPASTSASSTSSAPSSSTTHSVTAGFASLGCFADLAPTRAFATRLLALDTMNIDVCLSAISAALPATKYGYFGLEYGRECWAATTQPPLPTSYVGKKACAMACMGDPSESCGGQKMFNLYVTTTATASLSAQSVATVTKG